MSDTRNIVPRGDLDGSLGTVDKRWETMYAGTFHGDLNGTATLASSAASVQGYKVSTTNIPHTIPVRDINGDLASDTSQNASFKNIITNGNMIVTQRNLGVGQYIYSDGDYITDRWKIEKQECVNEGRVSLINVLNSIIDEDALYAIRLERYQDNVNQPNVGSISVTQAIESENTMHLWGNNVTVSFWARKFGGNNDVVLKPQLQASTTWNDSIDHIDNTSNVNHWNNTLSTIDTVVGDWNKYSYTVTLPQGYLSLRLSFICETEHQGGKSIGGFDISNVQLEKGNIATALERRPYGLESQLCYRYYYQTDSNKPVHGSYGNSLTYANTTIMFPVIMRSIPSITVLNSNGNYFESNISDRHYSHSVTGIAEDEYAYVSIAANAEIF